nr:immunoglobulin light chain junction region [Macaca mulatta]MOW57643.1 immunoglobulin light chain junction region [Macaca mulatta]MOW60781.1 immunoglobulin light chain junction region [Macaca mulatta]
EYYCGAWDSSLSANIF